MAKHTIYRGIEECHIVRIPDNEVTRMLKESKYVPERIDAFELDIKVDDGALIIDWIEHKTDTEEFAKWPST